MDLLAQRHRSYQIKQESNIDFDIGNPKNIGFESQYCLDLGPNPTLKSQTLLHPLIDLSGILGWGFFLFLFFQKCFSALKF